MIKTPLIFILNFLHLAFVGFPLAIMLYCTAHLFFELKRITKWITN